jgi:23S rRNA pseudouridine2605 synthase
VTTRDSGNRPSERLQKILARAGFGSRRASEALIAAGRVRVNGEVAALGARADPETDRIEVDGAVLGIRPGLVHYLLNKPAGVVTTASDPRGRPTVVGLVPAEPRVFPVGRLDADTEGLLLLMNDGELGHRLMHPSFEVEKTYLAEVQGSIPRDLGRRLRDGIELEDGPATVDRFRLVDSHAGRSMIELVIHEGRKHIVRRLLEEVGYPVLRLLRTAVGEVQLGNQRPGRFRRLSHAEIGALYRSVGL